MFQFGSIFRCFSTSASRFVLALEKQQSFNSRSLSKHDVHSHATLVHCSTAPPKLTYAAYYSALISFAVMLLTQIEPALGQLTKATVPGTCKTELDCCLLGKCVAGMCVCNEGFTGPNCHQLDLIPSKDPNIEGFQDMRYPAWCGRAIYSDGQYHFIASFMYDKCFLGDYGTNSAFLRATAPHPLGPFTFQEMVLPPFHHGAHLERAPDGGYLIFGDGRDMPSSTWKKCSSSSSSLAVPSHTGRALLRSLGVNLYPLGNSPNDVHIVAHSKSMTGPWQVAEVPSLRTNIKLWNEWNCNITNFAPLILKNGTVIMAFRSKSCIPMNLQNCDLNGCQHIGIAVSDNGVAGPYTIRGRIPSLTHNEDPFFWQNEETGYFYIIMHGKKVCGDDQQLINNCGTLAYSKDSYTWFLSPYATYDDQVYFDPSLNKKPEALHLRQRPKILFSNDGVPLALYNGGKRFSQNNVRSFAFAFNVEKMRNYQAPPVCAQKTYLNRCTTVTSRDGELFNRTQEQCRILGEQNCAWCPSTNLCMPGTDARVCDSDPEVFFKHCQYF